MNAPLKLGRSIARREDRRFLTGRGRYTDDTAPAGTLAVSFVRSPHAHARLAGIHTAAALAAPGVVAVYTAQDLVADGVGHLPAISEIKDEAGNRHREPPHLPMPVGKVRHVGDIVAMVVAETLDQARDAALRTEAWLRQDFAKTTHAQQGHEALARLTRPASAVGPTTGIASESSGSGPAPDPSASPGP